MISNPFAQLPDIGNEPLSFFVDSFAESLPHNAVPPPIPPSTRPTQPSDTLLPRTQCSSLSSSDHASHVARPRFGSCTMRNRCNRLMPPSPSGLAAVLFNIHQPTAQTTDHPGHDRSYQRNPPTSSHCLSITRACPGTARFERDNERVADESSSSIARQLGYLVEEDVSPTTPRQPQRSHCQTSSNSSSTTQLPPHSDNRLLSSTPRPEEISTPCASKACSDNRIPHPPPAVPQPHFEPTMLGLFMLPTPTPLERHAMTGDYHLGSFLAGGDQRFPSQVSTLAAHGLPRVG
ncbi:hypothetical protein RB213_012123 [Colletotrichum asianum]